MNYSNFSSLKKILISYCRRLFKMPLLKIHTSLIRIRKTSVKKNVLARLKVSENMRRDLLMRYFHFANNDAPTKIDELFEMRFFISKLNRNFLNYFVPECQLSYNEAMIRYFGYSGLRQCICNKRIRFCFEVRCLTSSSGYLVQFEI